MKKYYFLSFLLLACLLPRTATAAIKVKVEVPAGMQNVQILSGGTASVLGHLRGNLNVILKALDEQYGIAALKASTKQAQAEKDKCRKAFNDAEMNIRDEYLRKIQIKIISAKAEISPRVSGTGEVLFYYEATNLSDKIIESVTYETTVGNTKLQTKRTLEFFDPITLKFGLAPGKTFGNSQNNPENISFMITELKKENIENIKASLPKTLTILCTDLNFLSAVGYRDQVKPLNIEGAFPSIYKELKDQLDAATASATEKLSAYNQASTEYDIAKTGAVDTFNNAAEELKKSALRYRVEVNAKGKGRIMINEEGDYILYATQGKGPVVFMPFILKSGMKIKADKTIKDPFIP